MSGMRLDGDTVVALLGVVMVAAILSRNSALHRLSFGRKAIYAAAWLGIFVIAAIAASYLVR